MSENSSIEWTHHTFNPWSGCFKISPGCANCYAAAAPPSMRRGAVWGPEQERKPASESYWAQPLKWNRDAAQTGERRRVFCASMADVFEDRADLDSWRERLWKLIEATPSLDWLLLTKRPERMLAWSKKHPWPDNAWAGTSVENQEVADKRIPLLLQVLAPVRFLSCEPLLGAVKLDLRARWDGGCVGGCLEADLYLAHDGAERCRRCGYPLGGTPKPPIDWVIVGGESGRNARPMHMGWARSLRDQCVAVGAAFHFKQWGEWDPGLEERFMPIKVGKKAAGRLLDGRTWDEVPDAHR